MKFDYEKIVELRKQSAQIIWDNPFFTGLPKLTRKQLYECIDVLVSKLDEERYYRNYGYESGDMRDAKDIAWDQKCQLIECLDEEFFKRKREG